jgi:hypothetical protein
VGVLLQGEGRRLVPEPFAHHLHRDSGLQGQRRMGVAVMRNSA